MFKPSLLLHIADHKMAICQKVFCNKLVNATIDIRLYFFLTVRFFMPIFYDHNVKTILQMVTESLLDQTLRNYWSGAYETTLWTKKNFFQKRGARQLSNKNAYFTTSSNVLASQTVQREHKEFYNFLSSKNLKPDNVKQLKGSEDRYKLRTFSLTIIPFYMKSKKFVFWLSCFWSPGS